MSESLGFTFLNNEDILELIVKSAHTHTHAHAENIQNGLSINISTLIVSISFHNFAIITEILYTVKMNMLYLINKIVATDYKQYYLLN